MNQTDESVPGSMNSDDAWVSNPLNGNDQDHK